MPNRFRSTTLDFSLNSKSHRKSAIGNLKIATFKLQISKRRGWDSNPRYSFPYTAFPVLPVQPLLHLSGFWILDFWILDCSLQIENRKSKIGNQNGGEGGIRTHGTLTGTTVFETARFNHSRTSPHDPRLTSFEKKGL